MPAPLLGALALQMGASVVNNMMQRSENSSARSYNRQLASLQNQYNIDQWHRENTYNSPMNQRRRLMEAGFNPNLAFSNGLQNLAASSPELTAGAPGTPAPVGFGLGTSPTDIALANSQIKKNEADAANASTGSEKNLAEIDSIRTMTEENQKSMGLARDFMSKQMSVIDAQVEQIRASTRGQDILNDINSIEQYVKSMSVDDVLESYRLNNRLLKSEEASNYASSRLSLSAAEEKNLANRIVRAAQSDPERFAKLVKNWCDGQAISSEQLVEAVGLNLKEGNYSASNAHENVVGDSVIGAMGLITSVLGNILKISIK